MVKRSLHILTLVGFLFTSFSLFSQAKQYVVLDYFNGASTLDSINWNKAGEAIVPSSLNNGVQYLISKETITDQTDFLEVPYTLIEELHLYKKSVGSYSLIEVTGNKKPFHNRNVEVASLVFDVMGKVKRGDEVILVAKSELPLYLPVNQLPEKDFVDGQRVGLLFFGAYIGVFLALFLYNLFLYFSTKDRSYLPYLFFLISLCIAQATIAGFGFEYLWPNSPGFNNLSIPLFTALAGVFGLLFSKYFLLADQLNVGIHKKWINALIALYILSGIFAFFNLYFISFNLLNLLGIIASVYLLILAVYIWKKGYKPAMYYFIAWSAFLVSLITLAFRNLGVLPFNDITSYLGFFGASAQAVLLSLALADRINVLRKEHEKAQAEALRVSRENERIIREQNEELERRVHERTLELQEANEELKVTLTNLKETQSQLVDAEKMASLGQLTAGIAHEINNPINFVTSNITPLRRDVDEVMEIVEAYSAITIENVAEKLKAAEELKEELDYDYLKTEIDSLIEGVADGANRTKEIVRGLRTFSRLDEDVVKTASINEGLKSTLVLLKNKTKNAIEVVEDYDDQLDEVECYPGKLNQTFMNILNNGIYAVSHKKAYHDDEKPTITIKTRQEGSMVKVHLMDNGIGMDEKTRKKLFEPFFTTKDVGEGTGLGMSIVFKIVEKHNGKIEVNSELGKGTEFIITLPMRQPTEFS